MVTQKSLSGRRNVALLVHGSSDWSRQVHEGITAYSREHKNWDCWLRPRGLTDLHDFTDQWVGDGIIGRFPGSRYTDSIAKLGHPTVNVSWRGEHSAQIPKVMSDQAACGRLAGQFYLDAGFQQIAYIGPQSYLNDNDLILPELVDLARDAGIGLHIFQPDQTAESSGMGDPGDGLSDWIARLPGPVGIVAWSTLQARQAILCSMKLGLDVPNDVAVLSIEHDALLCSLSPIPISHVVQRPQVVGYEAASLLDRLMNRESPPEQPLLVAPMGIHETISTQTQFKADQLVQQAVEFISDNISQPLQVGDLVDKLQVSRRTLEDRFRKTLNRSPAEEIRIARVNQLKHLLRHTQLPLGEIALRCGFAYQEVMIRFFKKATGMTPGCYRKDADKVAWNRG